MIYFLWKSVFVLNNVRRAQIKKWVPEWIKSPICNSHLSTASAASPDLNAIAPPHDVEACRKPSPPQRMHTSSDANIDPSLSPRNDIGYHKPGASVSFMLPPMLEQHPSHSTLPTGTDAIDDFMFTTPALPRVHPNHANGSAPGKLHEDLDRGNPQSSSMHNQGQDCFMTEALYEAPWSATVDPPLMRAPSRASSMSLDQKVFLGNSRSNERNEQNAKYKLNRFGNEYNVNEHRWTKQRWRNI